MKNDDGGGGGLAVEAAAPRRSLAEWRAGGPMPAPAVGGGDGGEVHEPLTGEQLEFAPIYGEIRECAGAVASAMQKVREAGISDELADELESIADRLRTLSSP